MRSPFPMIPFSRPWPWVSLSLSLLALVLFWIPEAASFLEYDRRAIASGELWRLLTGHWTHWDVSHLFWDLLAFAGLGAVCEIRSRRRLAWGLGLSVVLVSVGIWIFLPEMERYRGLSGLDSMLFALLLAELFQESQNHRQRLWVLLAGTGLIAKILWESATGTTVFVSSDPATMIPVPLAHLIGALCGALAGLFPKGVLPRLSRIDRPFFSC